MSDRVRSADLEDVAAAFEMLSWSWEQLLGFLRPDGYPDDWSRMREVVEGVRDVIPQAVTAMRAGQLTVRDAADILEGYRWLEGLMCAAPTNTPTSFASDPRWNELRAKAAAIAANLAHADEG